MLKSSSFAALVEISNFRKRYESVFVNCFAQSYILSEAWLALSGLTYSSPTSGGGGELAVAQVLVAKQAIVLIASGDVRRDHDIPKMKRAPLTGQIFQQLCKAQATLGFKL